MICQKFRYTNAKSKVILGLSALNLSTNVNILEQVTINV